MEFPTIIVPYTNKVSFSAKNADWWQKPSPPDLSVIQLIIDIIYFV